VLGLNIPRSKSELVYKEPHVSRYEFLFINQGCPPSCLFLSPECFRLDEFEGFPRPQSQTFPFIACIVVWPCFFLSLSRNDPRASVAKRKPCLVFAAFAALFLFPTMTATRLSGRAHLGFRCLPAILLASLGDHSHFLLPPTAESNLPRLAVPFCKPPLFPSLAWCHAAEPDNF